MLMPPQQTQKPSPQEPLSPSNPDYNFIFNGEQKPKKRFNISLPGVSSLPRPVVFGLIAAIALIVIIPIASAIFSKTPNSEQLVRAAAKAQEIIRISGMVGQQTRDSNTQSLAITTSSSLLSDQVQLKTYLSSHKTKVNSKSLAVYLNKNTDAELQTATQTNSLETAYAAYLKKQLTDYRNYLQQVYPDSPSKAKLILKEAFTSSSVLLSTPAVSSSS